MSIIVKSKDGVEFAVETARGDWQTVVAERQFALTRTARELESFGDYRRVDPLIGYVAAPAPAPAPAPTRPALRLIRGGKMLPEPAPSPLKFNPRS
jgi:hypothetical protein